MASPAKLTSLLILTFLFIIQIHARESHFFSKIPNNNNGESTQIPTKIDPLTNTEKTQDPNFIPQTQDTGYGLYGHESGQLPPFNEKYDDEENKYRGNDAVSFKTESEEYYNNDDVNNNNNNDDVNNNNNNNDDDNFNNNNFQNSNSYKKPYENSFYYNKDLYDNRRQSFPNARLSRNDYTTTSYDNYNGNSNGRDNANNVVRQGMSDTRFMGNGKYFYDLEKEPHHYRNSRGNFGNNNNANSDDYGRYQNDEAEFQDEPDQFSP